MALYLIQSYAEAQLVKKSVNYDPFVRVYYVVLIIAFSFCAFVAVLMTMPVVIAELIYGEHPHIDKVVTL
jgi:hypothetical protein